MTIATDSTALQTRIGLQEKLSSFDLNGWIFSHFPYQVGERWLDLGCGTGKQSVPLAKAGCEVTAVDASEESLAKVRAEAPAVRTVLSDMDEFGASAAGHYDKAIASYSLYYSNDYPRLLRSLAKLTDALFFCGPAHTNNMEIRELIRDLTGKPVEPTFASRFMEEIGPRLARAHFGEVETFTFENEVVFPSPDDLYAYWSNHGLFDPSLEKEFWQLTERLSMPFINRKRGIGVRARR
jgi:SAM-dependent methyltransferase